MMVKGQLVVSAAFLCFPLLTGACDQSTAFSSVTEPVSMIVLVDDYSSADRKTLKLSLSIEARNAPNGYYCPQPTLQATANGLRMYVKQTGGETNRGSWPGDTACTHWEFALDLLGQPELANDLVTFSVGDDTREEEMVVGGLVSGKTRSTVSPDPIESTYNSHTVVAVQLEPQPPPGVPVSVYAQFPGLDGRVNRVAWWEITPSSGELVWAVGQAKVLDWEENRSYELYVDEYSAISRCTVRSCLAPPAGRVTVATVKIAP